MENPILWNSKEKVKINTIKKKFEFYPEFDLHGSLAQLSVESASLKAKERETPTIKEIEITLNLFDRHLAKLEKSLKNRTTILPFSSKQPVAKLISMFDTVGEEIIKLITKSTNGGNRALPTLRELLVLLSNNTLKEPIKRVREGIKKAKSGLPKAKSGRKEDNFERGVIHLILNIYINGTGRKAQCNWDVYADENDPPGTVKYHGEFYDFLLEVVPLIKEAKKDKKDRNKIPLKFLKKNTWGAYAREVVRHHYRKKAQKP
jgi:hypothetical protein